jgi:DNA-binding winged helix-turn-helix (wHTH) protein
MSSTLPSQIRFANFEVDLRAGELRKDGSKVRLQEQPFLLLTVLLESPGELVTREELRKRLWSADTFVDFDHRLAVAISKLRDALWDSAEKPKFVETVGRRGYRFLGQIESTGSLSVDTKAGTGETALPSLEQPELPRLVPLGPTRSRTSRLIFLSSIGSAILLGVIVLPKFLHTRSGKAQPLPPAAWRSSRCTILARIRVATSLDSLSQMYSLRNCLT